MPVVVPSLPPFPPYTKNIYPALVFNKWRKALANVRNGTSNARILCVGDSSTAGFGDGSYATIPQTNSYPTRLASLLNTAITPTVVGLAIPASNISANTDNRWSLGTGWARVPATYNNATQSGTYMYGAGGNCSIYATGTTGNLVFTPSPQVTCDSFIVYYLSNTAYGTMNMTATGGTSTPVNGNQGDYVIHSATISGTSGSANTLTMTSVGSNYILGVEPVLSTKKQVLVGNMGAGGTSSGGWADTTSTGYCATTFIKTIAPDLTIVSLGLNDGNSSVPVATFQANMQAIITAAKISGDVLLCDFPPSDPARFAAALVYEAQYLSVYATLAAANSSAYLSLNARLGGAYNTNYMYTTDGLHLTDQGYWDWAQFVASVIANS